MSGDKEASLRGTDARVTFPNGGRLPGRRRDQVGRGDFRGMDNSGNLSLALAAREQKNPDE
jgi:hypothetical protein